MSNELHAECTTGLTAYCVLLNSTGQVWNGTAFEAVAGGSWTNYDVALTEAAAGIYLADMPTSTAGAYTYVVYEQAGGTPAVTDTVLGTGHIVWDGSAEVNLNAVPWNAAWDAEVQSECADALTAYDPPTDKEMDNAFAALNDVSTAEVNAQVLDVLNVDTFSELMGVPADDTTLTNMVRWLYILARNKIEQTETTQTLYADDESTEVASASVGVSGGTFTRGEFS